ncbi:PREDICTED: adhesion G protein-coupled receptor E1-like [Acropora digitifera]|uniref:adhesion G protein-coupled receptor E1-like n=1 Tax=Acropora digitifera TaxID=70779 RepID=UPI00077A9275|nr:PREDICTED: adhesion G protein-coupled receptor E1-like [Acropora digitifera]
MGKKVLRNSQEMTTLFWFCIVFMISHVVEKTVAQQCAAERSISGWMLQRHVYKTALADIGLHCLSSCGTDVRCQSFNFVMSSHMCEFSDRTKEATPEDFIHDPGRYYFGKRVNRVPLGSIPELAAKSCKEIKMSEKEATSSKYWLSSIRPDIPLFAFCNMTTEDIDECTASLPVCHVSAQCTNTIGSYRCTCDPGYTGNGKACTDVNECTALPSACHVNAQCSNTIGSYRCDCGPGYTGNGKTCIVTSVILILILVILVIRIESGEYFFLRYFPS